MKRILSATLLVGAELLCFVAPASSQNSGDAAAIKQTALDYVEGWYEGNAERMERAVHPDLAKRIVSTNPRTGKDRLDQLSALRLVQLTRDGAGTKTTKDKQQKGVTILDQYVKIVFADWIDYAHLAKFNGRWVIVNVLWQFKPKPQEKNP